MEEKTIFEGLIEEAKRVTKEHSDSVVMMIMFEKCDGYIESSCSLLGGKKDITISLVEIMEESEILVDIIKTAIIMYDIKKTLKNR